MKLRSASRILKFRVVVGAPTGVAEFRAAGGWEAFRHDLGANLPGSSENRPALPVGETWCGRVSVSLAEKLLVVSRELHGMLDAILPAAGRGLPLWLPHPPEGLLPLRFSLTRALPGHFRTGVWAAEHGWTLVNGAYYSYDPGARPADVSADAQWTLGAGELANAIVGWTAPLVIEINPARTRVAWVTPAQRKFWRAALAPRNVVDIAPQFATVAEGDPADALRIRYYQKAAEWAERNDLAPWRRSALQTLVFGQGKRPAPCWFLILDALDGRFQLEDFSTGRPRWSWIPSPQIDFWNAWLGRLACRRADISRVRARTTTERCVDASAFRAIRWREAGAERGNVAPAAAVQNGDGHSGANGSTDTWQLLLGEICPLRPSCPIEPEVFVRQLSGQLLLPRSPVMVRLPAWPFGSSGEVESEWWRLQSQWYECVNDLGWLDLVSSALWPEAWWPAGLLWNGTPAADANPWRARGRDWHHSFYSALHNQPASFTGKWHIDLPFALGRSALKSACKLGPTRARLPIQPFVLR